MFPEWRQMVWCHLSLRHYCNHTHIHTHTHTHTHTHADLRGPQVVEIVSSSLDWLSSVVCMLPSTPSWWRDRGTGSPAHKDNILPVRTFTSTLSEPTDPQRMSYPLPSTQPAQLEYRSSCIRVFFDFSSAGWKTHDCSETSGDPSREVWTTDHHGPL